MNIPPSFKPITPFIRRAEELDKDHSMPETKVVAYFCRMHAIETGIKLGDSSPEGSTFLIGLMGKLEDDKSALPPNAIQQGEVITYICTKHKLQFMKNVT